MLIWGQTVLKPHLEGFVYIVYWVACFLFTFLAIVTAMLDLRATRKRTEAEQRELLERTLQDIEEKKSSPPGAKSDPPRNED